MRKVAIRTNVVDRPDRSHKTHNEPIPYLGGIAIILGVVIVTSAGLVSRDLFRENALVAASLLIPAIFLGLIGLIDDIKNLSPLPRLLAQSLAGIFTASILIQTNTVGNPTGNSLIDAGITIFWVVGITNSINFFDNLDGGAAGAVAAAALGIFLISNKNGQFFLASLSIVLFGAMIGFLIWNKSPARIYMGDAGALFLGIVISVLALRLDPNVNSKVISFSIPILILAIPILDTTVAVISRIKRGISPFEGGRDHLSHRIIRLGFSRRKTAISLWSLSLMFVGVAFAISNSLEFNFLVLGITSLAWVALLIVFSMQKDSD
jgi:UDP-GlcNAc:undecaprenyl-phosphate GlcNAc-1-phosphate transferase